MLRIALLGAESTGKTRLSIELANRLTAEGMSCTLVGEYLRDWCSAHGRTPAQEEQAHIMSVQQSRIDQASAADVLIADTTPFVNAAYSEWLFGDHSLYPAAVASLRRFDLILLAATDLPWQPDGIQRTGALQRLAFDACLRGALSHVGLGFRVIYGSGEERIRNALLALACCAKLDRTLAARWIEEYQPRELTRWQRACEKCSDPQCEHRLFTARLGLTVAGPGLV